MANLDEKKKEALRTIGEKTDDPLVENMKKRILADGKERDEGTPGLNARLGHLINITNSTSRRSLFLQIAILIASIVCVTFTILSYCRE